MSDRRTMPEIAPIQPNGSLILAWQVKNRHVLVIGGGEVAAGRIYHLLNADAKVTVIAPTVNAEIAHREGEGLLYAVHRRSFEMDDLDMYQRDPPVLQDYTREEYQRIDEYLKQSRFELVLVAIDDPIESQRIYYHCKLKGLNVNIADVPQLCDFYFGAIFRKGHLQVMVSTNGQGPRMARLIKDQIAGMFDDLEIDKTIANIGQLRKLLRAKCPGNDLQDIKTRMEWMTEVTDMYSFKQWSGLNPASVVKYFPQMPPCFEDLNQPLN